MDTLVIPRIGENFTTVQDTYTRNWETGVVTQNGFASPIGNYVWPECSNWANVPGGSGLSKNLGYDHYKFEWEDTGTPPPAIWVVCRSGAEAEAFGLSSHSVNGSNGQQDDFVLNGNRGEAIGTHLHLVSLSQGNDGKVTGQIDIPLYAKGEATGSGGLIQTSVMSTLFPDTRSITVKINGGSVMKMAEAQNDSDVQGSAQGDSIHSVNEVKNEDDVIVSRLPEFSPHTFTGTYRGAHQEQIALNWSTPVDVSGTVRVSFPMPQRVWDFDGSINSPTVTGTDKANPSATMTWSNDGHQTVSGNASMLGDTATYSNSLYTLFCTAPVLTNHVEKYIHHDHDANQMPRIIAQWDPQMTCTAIGEFKGKVAWDDGLKGNVNITVDHLPCVQTVGNPNIKRDGDSFGTPGVTNSFGLYDGQFEDFVFVPWNNQATYTSQAKPISSSSYIQVANLIATVANLAAMEIPHYAMLMSAISVVDGLVGIASPSSSETRPATLPEYYKFIFDSGFEMSAGTDYLTDAWWGMSRSYETKVKMSVVDTYGPLGYQGRSIGVHREKGSGSIAIYFFSDSDRSLGAPGG